jgi:hypothetical protein
MRLRGACEIPLCLRSPTNHLHYGESTRWAQKQTIEVIDLGLRLADIDGLESEEVSYQQSDESLESQWAFSSKKSTLMVALIFSIRVTQPSSHSRRSSSGNSLMSVSAPRS